MARRGRKRRLVLEDECWKLIAGGTARWLRRKTAMGTCWAQSVTGVSEEVRFP